MPTETPVLAELEPVERLFPSIVTTPDVCGGEPRLIRTRIPVWSLERMRQLGVSESEILTNFPGLQRIDLVSAWAFAELYREAVERAILENEGE